jgi:hypothetical protein
MLVFHFRAVSKGSAPFAQDWESKPVCQMAGHEKEAVEYMRDMRRKVQKLGRLLLYRFSMDGGLTCMYQTATFDRGKLLNTKGRTPTVSTENSLPDSC